VKPPNLRRPRKTWNLLFFIAALRHVVDARGGLARVVEVGSLTKASLYKAIPHSGHGNPTTKTMFAALRASGLHLTFSASGLSLISWRKGGAVTSINLTA
jgi:DNA-binding phage protein